MKMVIERWIFGIAYFQAHPSCGRLMEHFMGIEARIHGIFHLDIHGSTIFVHPENLKNPLLLVNHSCQKPWFSQQDDTTLLGRGFIRGCYWNMTGELPSVSPMKSREIWDDNSGIVMETSENILGKS